VQGDEPLSAPRLIAGVAQALERRREASVATACHPMRDLQAFANPNVVKVVLDAKGDALYFSRAGIPFPRQGGVPAWYRHVGIYAYRMGFLRHYAELAPAPLEAVEQLEQLRVLWHGYRIATVIEEGEVPPGVDTPQDLAAVLRLLR
jgi:3-deoxy-manno-octulosonate cytidylyltransferase (CMP-KDO synthetase)